MRARCAHRRWRALPHVTLTCMIKRSTYLHARNIFELKSMQLRTQRRVLSPKADGSLPHVYPQHRKMAGENKETEFAL
jgi:hypothetical protein